MPGRFNPRQLLPIPSRRANAAAGRLATPHHPKDQPFRNQRHAALDGDHLWARARCAGNGVHRTAAFRVRSFHRIGWPQAEPK